MSELDNPATRESHPGSFPVRVGRYELLLPLGTGGMATVYLARSRGEAGFEREVALKLVHAHLRADEESRLHLLEEARLAARIRHPNVVPVTEVGTDPCGVFLVMDYVEGETLSGLTRALQERKQTIPTRFVARIINDALLGLHAAHELRDDAGEPLGLVHRDFSPQNILLGVEGVTRLTDFGVAKAASRNVRTKTGLVKGKVAYMSPEQARGHRVDRRCDVWAAGVVCWEMLAGRRLYDQEDDVSTLLCVVTQEPPRLSSAGVQDLPLAVEEAVAYALTPDVNQRCPSAESLRALLEPGWEAIGGMATQVELGRFVQQVLGDKLAERRHRASRSKQNPQRDSPYPLRSATDAGLLAEDGTKTAVSAEVRALVPPLAKPRRYRWAAPVAAASVFLGAGAWFFAQSGSDPAAAPAPEGGALPAVPPAPSPAAPATPAQIAPTEPVAAEVREPARGVEVESLADETLSQKSGKRSTPRRARTRHKRPAASVTTTPQPSATKPPRTEQPGIPELAPDPYTR